MRSEELHVLELTPEERAFLVATVNPLAGVLPDGHPVKTGIRKVRNARLLRAYRLGPLTVWLRW